MEAATLQSKKAIKKGKIKKTLKNILCRPDPVFWPLISDEQKKGLEIILAKHKIDIPKWDKPNWKDLKDIPKAERPKPPKIMKPEGLLFGISECTHAISTKNCAVVMVESAVNPRTLVQPIIEACTTENVPVVCVNDLRTVSANNFGIPTSCLGVKTDFLPDLNNKVSEIAKTFYLPEPKKHIEPVEHMDTSSVEQDNISEPLPVQCPYLYRTNKKTRVFIPPEGTSSENLKIFKGQDFIEFSAKPDTQKLGRKSYMNMVLKKISNNPNRVKVK